MKSGKQDQKAGMDSIDGMRRELAEACRTLGITPASILLNLKRLSEFKASKAFSHQGQVFYADPVDVPEIQLSATKALADILGMKEADKGDTAHAGAITIRIKGRDESE
jgi:hypothetical protein